ncbi:hypothetical protein BC830DRAFT_1170089 [Chytriomyces sp. MP71]|nr:hypothetical protein BC830DRAFT_1170089 [Chytriomyces sp. MP71]
MSVDHSREVVNPIVDGLTAPTSSTLARPYQVELVEQALERNIIAFLDTGSGKTLVSVRVMEALALPLAPIDGERVRDSIEEARKQGNWEGAEASFARELNHKQPKKIVFVAPTVALVKQQARTVRATSSLVVGEYSRADSASLSHWDHLGWVIEASSKQVLVFTPQILLNVLRHGFMTLADVNLIVFDECHHACKNHPYANIMDEFYSKIPPENDKPKILGMTASPIYQKTSSMRDTLERLQELQNTLDCTIITVSDRTMLDGYVSRAKEYIIEYNPRTSFLIESIDASLCTVSARDHSVGAYMAFKSNSERFFAFYVSALLRLEQLDPSLAESARKCLNLIRDVEIDLGIWCAGKLAMRLFNSISSARKYSRGPDIDPTLVQTCIFETVHMPCVPTLSDLQDGDISPKVETLLDIIRTRIQKTPTSFRGMIFVEKRTTASTLSDLLSHLAPRFFPDIKAAFITGQGSATSGHDKMSTNYQQRVLDRFRRGEVNLLIVTRVAEEGIDMYAYILTFLFSILTTPSPSSPACKLILLFDLFRSNTGYVQSRGRARDPLGSEFMLLARRGDTHALDALAQAKVAETLTRAVVSRGGSCVQRGASDDAVVEGLVADECVVTRAVEVRGSAVDSILGRFMKGRVEYEEVPGGEFDGLLKMREDLFREAGVARDEFVPTLVTSSGSGFAYAMRMSVPERGQVRIVGSQRFTRKLAMQSAGLETIRYLHAVGLLNDNLLPTNRSNKQKSRAFSFARQLRQLAKLDSKAGNEASGKKRFVYDPASGESRDDAAFLFHKRVPRCFRTGIEWHETVDKSAMTDEKSLKLPPQYVEVHFSIISLGPEAEAFTRGTNPPICEFSSLCSQDFDDYNRNPYYITLNGYPPSQEPRRTFALVTATALPPGIPDFPSFLPGSTCKVSISSWSNEAGTSAVQITRSDFEALKEFQKKFWALSIYQHKASASAPVSAGSDNAEYMIAPMIGIPLLAESKMSTDFFPLPLTPDEAWSRPESLLSTCDFKWRVDWATVKAVACEARVSLYDWILLIEARLSAHRAAKKSKSSLKLGSTGYDKKITSCFLGPVVDDDALSDVESESDIDDEQLQTDDAVSSSVLDHADAFEILPKQRSSSKQLLKRKIEVVEELVPRTESNALLRYWESVENVESSTSFRKVFEVVQAASLECEVESEDVWRRIRSTPSLNAQLTAVLKQTLIQTSHNGIVYIAGSLNTSLNATSAFETEKFEGVACFGDYFSKLGYVIHQSDAPLIQVHNIPARHAYTRAIRKSAKTVYPTPDSVEKFLALEACSVLPIPAELLRFSNLLPSIIHRLNNFCLMDDLRTDLNLRAGGLSFRTLLPAFTASSTMDPFSYERLETLGDAFLKFACTADLMHRFPQASEGELSRMRGGIVSNRNLCSVAMRFKLGEVMVVGPFKAKSWQPPGAFRASEKEKSGLLEIRFSEKRLADFVEALVGAAVIDGGSSLGLRLLATFGLVPSDSIQTSSDERLNLEMDAFHHGLDSRYITPSTLNSGFNVERLEGRICYTFKNKALALQAMTHSSAICTSQSYETLEFLGDAVLDWLIMNYLFNTYPTLSPEKLSDLRQAAVNNESFCRLAAMAGLHEFLVHSSTAVNDQLTAYLAHLSTPGLLQMDPLSVPVEGPKVLGDLFESIVGAVFMDSDKNLEIVWVVLKPLIASFLKGCVNPRVVEKSPIRQMHEKLQELGFGPDEVWYNFSDSQQDNLATFLCEIYLLDVRIATESGNSRQLAKRRATVVALAWILENEATLVRDCLNDSRKNPGKNWRRSLTTGGVEIEAASTSVGSNPDPTNAVDLQDVSIGTTATHGAHAAGTGIEVSDQSHEEHINGKSSSAAKSPFDALEPFDAFLLALEMNQIRNQDEEQNRLARNPTSIPLLPVAAVTAPARASGGDYFLMQLLALQQQEQLELQRLHNEQLLKLFGSGAGSGAVHFK